jgi:hypothetical protein
MDDFEVRCQKSAENIMTMLQGNHSNIAVRAALKLAYTSGARDEQLRRINEMVKRDDELSEVTG